MKYAAVLAAFAAGALAQSGTTSAPVPSATLSPQLQCVAKCAGGDVTCQAACLGIARPNESQAIETNECAAKCDQGNGSPEATDKYAKCQQDCFYSKFPSSQTIAPFAPGAASTAAGAGASATSAAGSAAGSAASSGASRTNSAASGASSGASSAASSAGSQASGNAASGNSVKLAGAGLAGFMAIFAL